MTGGDEQLISQEIEVERDSVSGELLSFSWNGQKYTISETIAAWSDWGFAGGSPRRKNWRMRRHRNCYRVETTDGAVYELYHDRGVSLAEGKWILHTRLDKP